MVEAVDPVAVELHRAGEAAERGAALEQRDVGAGLGQAQRQHRPEDAAADDPDARRAHAARSSSATRRGRSDRRLDVLGDIGEIGGGWMRPTRCAAIRRP